jgi:hypothetical protein
MISEPDCNFFSVSATARPRDTQEKLPIQDAINQREQSRQSSAAHETTDRLGRQGQGSLRRLRAHQRLQLVLSRPPLPGRWRPLARHRNVAGASKPSLWRPAYDFRAPRPWAGPQGWSVPQCSLLCTGVRQRSLQGGRGPQVEVHLRRSNTQVKSGKARAPNMKSDLPSYLYTL